MRRRKMFKAKCGTDARMSLYYGKVIPASVKQEVNKLVDQTQRKLEAQSKKPVPSEANAGEPDEISAQNRPPAKFGRRVLHAQAVAKTWWARQDSNLRPPACEAGALTN